MNFDDDIYKISMFQSWPIRKPRPVQESLELTEPVETGLRIYDCFFPFVYCFFILNLMNFKLIF